MTNNPHPFIRGSQWRRWDLHIHTPYSALNNGFGTGWENYAKKLFDSAIKKGISVIGVTDYFCIEGYKKLVDLQESPTELAALLGEENAQIASQILLLPNIELRSTPVISHKNGTAGKLNFHIIFSDELSAEAIQEHFLRELKISVRSHPGGPDENWSLTLPNLQDLGKRLKQEQLDFRDKTDLEVGMMNATVPHEKVTAVLEDQASRFRNKYLIVVPIDEDLPRLDWSSQAHLERKLPTQKAHMFFSSNRGTRQFGLGYKHSNVQAFASEFGPRKPCIHGSDAHTFDQLFQPEMRRYLWIKADPTFRGLRQLLNEPEKRIYIGERPPGGQGTATITALEIKPTPHAENDPGWFDVALPLNSGLVAIIGNKGGGKSALADIIGVAGNSHSKPLSFLNTKRFLRKQDRLGEKFEARLHWSRGEPSRCRLDVSPDTNEPEKVKYLPQSYLESLCGSLTDQQSIDIHGAGSAFYNELADIVFSHLEKTERLNQDNLAGFIKHITRETERQIMQRLDALHELNDEIFAAEKRMSPVHLRNLKTKLSRQCAKLDSHRAQRPTPVSPPKQEIDTDTDPVNLHKAKLDELIGQAQSLDAEIKQHKDHLSKANIRQVAAERLLTRLETLQQDLDDFLVKSEPDASTLDLSTEDIFKYSINVGPIHKVQSSTSELVSKLQAKLDPTSDDSLLAKRQAVSKDLESVSSCPATTCFRRWLPPDRAVSGAC